MSSKDPQGWVSVAGEQTRGGRLYIVLYLAARQIDQVCVASHLILFTRQYTPTYTFGILCRRISRGHIVVHAGVFLFPHLPSTTLYREKRGQPYLSLVAFEPNIVLVCVFSSPTYFERQSIHLFPRYKYFHVVGTSSARLHTQEEGHTQEFYLYYLFFETHTLFPHEKLLLSNDIDMRIDRYDMR